MQKSKSDIEIYLAPMEGVVDAILRDILTRVGGIDRTVTEFVRICDLRLPSRVFYRSCPELTNSGITAAGVPVHIQVLGSNAEMMAANAVKAVRLGARGIDINFGCPAKTVNKNRGGSILLKEPEVIYQIVSQIRQAINKEIPVTAKMRLGYEDKSLAIDNAEAIAAAGADELCVHARTKVEGYRPPAHWEWVGKINDAVDIPVVANGDMFSVSDIQRCIDITGCNKLMIGRGLLRQPDLARQFKMQQQGDVSQPMTWSELLPLIHSYVIAVQQHMLAKHAPGRVKQWLAYLKQHHPEAQGLFNQVKAHMKLEPILAVVEDHLQVTTGLLGDVSSSSDDLELRT